MVVHGGRRVEQHGQQVLLHIAALGGVVVQELHDDLDVGACLLYTSGAVNGGAVRAVHLYR